MSLVRTLRCCACGGVGMLLLMGTSPAPSGGATGPDGATPAVDARPDGATPAVEAPADTAPAETNPDGTKPDESTDGCAADQACVDRYLWSLYERTPKVDTVGVPEQTKVTVKRKGKTRTVTRTVTKLIDENFAWKDPKAAERAGMSLMDYVIGGMDPGFRGRLYRALHALDDAGYKPGIMCAFRDDYRQSIATGLKAQNDRSFHGGSFRGGYGHGMAADIVSVRGDTRTDRLASSGQMWDFIDAHEKALGIGRPYLDRDPPHVGPLDGQEYADHRGKPKSQHAASEAKSRTASKSLPVHKAKSVTKRENAPRSSRVQSRARAPAI